MLHGIVLNARDISERTRARAQLEVQNAVARVLAEAINLSQSIPKSYRRSAITLIGNSVSSGASIETRERSSSTTHGRCPASTSGRFLDISQHTRIHEGEGLAGRVWQRASAIHVPDISHEENFVSQDRGRGSFSENRGRIPDPLPRCDYRCFYSVQPSYAGRRRRLALHVEYGWRANRAVHCP